MARIGATPAGQVIPVVRDLEVDPGPLSFREGAAPALPAGVAPERGLRAVGGHRRRSDPLPGTPGGAPRILDAASNAWTAASTAT